MSSMATPSKHRRVERKEDAVNVKVVVRCRPLSSREQAHNARVCCVANPHAKSVTVDESSSKKKSSKTFGFDSVYNGHSTQEELFDAQVKPLVEEVLSGFNCTVFAYGQTGTGKTYTMTGDFSQDAALPTAGIIPRAVHYIFQRLQKVREYSVKVSFLELYNEELTDLLSEDTDKKLRIFSDNTSKSKGVMVNNLEESHVASAEDVFGVIRSCMEKRRSASTLMNANSSRSHTIFTITIHSKASNELGEDVIKTGKMYLVDLAGSECIGRSGAVNQRAKEAGKINKSLLTLGRVINALVDKAGYVPYRDSKLTRLLRESLGGTAKTCIIATISPASDSMEETLSTLSYAHRAKNIKNKPQVNEKMTHKAYMHELLRQIQLLKRENEVLRTKNGIILPPEQYEEMKKALKSKASLLEEYEATLKVKADQFKELNQKFEAKDAELKETQELKAQIEQELKDTNEQLEQTKEELKATETALEEQKYLVEQHQQTEETMYSQATELKDTLETVLSDKDKLHDKIGRKHAVELHNQETSKVFKTTHQSSMNELQDNEQTFLQGQAQQYTAIEETATEANADVAQATQAGAENFQAFEQQLEQQQQQLAQIKTRAVEQYGSLATSALERSSALVSSVEEKLTSTETAVAQHSETMATVLNQQQEQIQQWNHDAAQAFDQRSKSAEDFVHESTQQMADVTAYRQKCTEQQTSESQHMQDELAAFQAQLHQQTQERMSSFMSSVQDLINGFVAQQNEVVKAAMDGFQAKLSSSSTRVSEEHKTTADKIRAHQDAANQWLKSEKATVDMQRTTAQQHVQDIEQFRTSMAQTHTDITDVVAGSVTCLRELNEQERHASAAHKGLVDQAAGAFAKEYDEQVNSACVDRATQFEQLRKHAQSMEVTQQAHCQRIADMCRHNKTAIAEQTEQLQAAVSGMNSKLEQYVHEDLKVDFPTGQTPQKKDVPYPTNIERTLDHDILLEQYRSNLKTVMETDSDDTSSDNAADTKIAVEVSVADVDVAVGPDAMDVAAQGLEVPTADQDFPTLAQPSSAAHSRASSHASSCGSAISAPASPSSSSEYSVSTANTDAEEETGTNDSENVGPKQPVQAPSSSSNGDDSTEKKMTKKQPSQHSKIPKPNGTAKRSTRAASKGSRKRVGSKPKRPVSTRGSRRKNLR